ncbi:PaaX family transcriptional regulator C-terminal domain-containing protein [Rhodococcus sp. CSLK01-03]|uniref:PaaX family transcriptional regulator C-terminal domain-containing protein n=1 Tax=Rhodococcus indonesiensis TaxID=3055869 RepID=A0ABT7RNY0_9NOCA|nr:PaaX family transcriptional regulator C-terminal domain-containing protein [Rhodococcus indonesiensis]MDM7489352.1 PaaX family transcriptional regulator C-terminal domain-containing protein [Rhodococcus indonesiensis]
MRTLDELMPALSARSVALSLLLGSRPPKLTARDLVSLGELFSVAPSTMRVALSRMTTAGDLVIEDGAYVLAPRHLERQATTDRRTRVRRRPYDGMWRMAVIIERGRDAEARAALRVSLTRERLAELREGVWLRPDNLADLDLTGSPELESFMTIPANDRRLSSRLWDLDTWAGEARLLLEVLTSPRRPIDHLTAAAATVRHLRTDPALPDELLPERWPGDELRWAYEDYRNSLTATHLSAIRARAQTEETTSP